MADTAAMARVEPLFSELTSRLGGAVQKTHPAGSPAELPAALADARRRLLAQGVDESLVQKALTACVENLSPRSLQAENRVQKQLRSQLEVHLRVRPGREGMDERVVCLVGVSGAGKTSSAAKLAAHHTQAGSGKVAWVCADTVRAGAIAEARVYAESLGIPLHLAYTPEELAGVVAEAQDAGLVLVDMPGCNPYREASVVELAALLTAVPRRTTYLVAPATARESDLAQALAAFSPFGLQGLVVTKMDETDRFGDIFNLAWHSQLPLAYFTTGSRALGDLQPAAASSLVSALFGDRA
jgi:flagellar biosynthesis protein FlhF